MWRSQIKETIKRHLEKELQLRELAGGRGIKVLSLFFIDRVANYRDYNGEGKAVKGKFAEAFEAELANWAKDQRFKDVFECNDAQRAAKFIYDDREVGFSIKK